MQIEELKNLNLRREAHVIKALAHPSRLLIARALLDNELCVCELRDLLGQNISTVSRHLSVLKNAGLLIEEKRGLYVYYHLCCDALRKFLLCMNKLVGETTQ